MDKYNKYDYLKEQLKKSMTIDGVVQKRYYHSLEVAKKALELNERLCLGLDSDKVYLAGLLHDAAKLKSDEFLWEIIKKEFPNELDKFKDSKPIWHSLAGPFVVKTEYGINDEEILSAICYHSTGKANMSTLDKVLFVADYIEDTRGGNYTKEAVDASFISLDKALKIILNQKVDFLRKSGKIICELTFEALKYYSENGEEC